MPSSAATSATILSNSVIASAITCSLCEARHLALRTGDTSTPAPPQGLSAQVSALSTLTTRTAVKNRQATGTPHDRAVLDSTRPPRRTGCATASKAWPAGPRSCRRHRLSGCRAIVGSLVSSERSHRPRQGHRHSSRAGKTSRMHQCKHSPRCLTQRAHSVSSDSTATSRMVVIASSLTARPVSKQCAVGGGGGHAILLGSRADGHDRTYLDPYEHSKPGLPRSRDL